MSIVRNHFADHFVIEVRRDRALPPPRAKPWKPSKAQVKAMDRYKAAYKAAYHMEPEIYFDGNCQRVYLYHISLCFTRGQDWKDLAKFYHSPSLRHARWSRLRCCRQTRHSQDGSSIAGNLDHHAHSR